MILTPAPSQINGNCGAGEEVGVFSIPVFRSTRRVLKTNRLRTGIRLIATLLWAFSPAPLSPSIPRLSVYPSVYRQILTIHYADLSVEPSLLFMLNMAAMSKPATSSETAVEPAAGTALLTVTRWRMVLVSVPAAVVTVNDTS